MASEKKMNGITEGVIWKQLLLFFFPILVGTFFQQLYNTVDSVIVGRFLGVNALAALGTTNSINFMVVGSLTGIAGGFGILIAQSFGAGDYKRLRHFVRMSVYLCIAIAVVMTTGLLIGDRAILHLINTPAEIIDDTSSYIRVIYMGLPITLMYNLLASIARSLGDSKTPLYFLVISSVVNIILDLLFVGVFGFGVAGAGCATVIAQGLSASLCFFYIRKKFDILRMTREDMYFSWGSAWKLLSMGVPMALQFSITAMGTMIVQSSLNKLGASYIAGFAAAGKIQGFIIQLFPSVGITLATYVGQNRGARDYKRIRKGVNSSVLITIVAGVVCSVFMYFWGHKCARFFVEDPLGEIQNIVYTMYHVSLWFYIPLGLIFVFRNTLQGLGDGLVPMLGGVCELLARGLIVLLLFDKLGFMAICMAEPGAWVSALIPLIPVYIYRMRKVEKV